MEFSKPEKFTARVSDKYYVSENERFLYIKFELVLPDRITFQAGQYVSLKINDKGERRSYSIASTPDDNHGFHLLVEIVDDGKGSDYLKSISIGEVVEILAPMGRFVVIQDNSGLPAQAATVTQNKLLFVATGSGVVPIWSMVNDLLINKQEKRQMRLHWGMRSEKDLFFVDNLARLSEEYPNFVFDIVLSQPGEEWELCSGHVQDCLMRDFAGGLEGWAAYICGKPERVVDIGNKLQEMGMVKEKIYHEKFV